jgi:hypothetical protein
MPKCRYCKKPNAEYKPTSSLSRFCDFDCAASYAIGKVSTEKEKAEKQKDKEKLELLNQTISHWKPKAQSAFNLFIRIRDLDQPCISCGTVGPKGRSENSFTGGFWDCGHYLSTGAAPELRFSEDNAHRQCKQCNKNLSGNAVKYRINLKRKIGEYRLSLLEEPGKHVNHYIDQLDTEDLEHADKVYRLESLLDPPRWRWQDYKAVYDYYTKLNNRLKKEL